MQLFKEKAMKENSNNNAAPRQWPSWYGDEPPVLGADGLYHWRQWIVPTRDTLHGVRVPPQRTPAAWARDFAEQIAASLQPSCERITIAGSLRRGSREVKDIEICAVPKFRRQIEAATPTSLFGSHAAITEPVSLIYQWASGHYGGGCAAAALGIRWIKTGTAEIVDWPPKPEAKYLRGLLPQGLKLDLFIGTASRWGALLLIRTGSKEFNQGVMKHARKLGCAFHGGGFYQNCVFDRDGKFVSGEELAVPEEEDIFRRLGIPVIEPELRGQFTGAHHYRQPAQAIAA
jgi:hypothetical protein